MSELVALYEAFEKDNIPGRDRQLAGLRREYIAAGGAITDDGRFILKSGQTIGAFDATGIRSKRLIAAQDDALCLLLIHDLTSHYTTGRDKAWFFKGTYWYWWIRKNPKEDSVHVGTSDVSSLIAAIGALHAYNKYRSWDKHELPEHDGATRHEASGGKATVPKKDAGVKGE